MVHVGPCRMGSYNGTIGSVNNAIDIRVSWEEGNFMSSRENVNFLTRALLQTMAFASTAYSPTCGDNELIIQSWNYECIQHVILCVLKAFWLIVLYLISVEVWRWIRRSEREILGSFRGWCGMKAESLTLFCWTCRLLLPKWTNAWRHRIQLLTTLNWMSMHSQ